MMDNHSLPENHDRAEYRGYAGLPPLLGLHSMHAAAETGLTVAESTDRLKRLHWALRRLHRIFVSRITATPVYEIKMAFSLHAHLCAEYVGKLADRVREMRQPPYGLQTSPGTAFDLFFDEIQCAPDLPALLLGLYEHAVPATMQAIEKLIEQTNKLFDHPTYRLCRLALIELGDIEEYGRKAVQCLVTEENREQLADWTAALPGMLESAGGLDGTGPVRTDPIAPIFSAQPYSYDGVPQRDERFHDLYNMGVNAEAMIFEPSIEPRPKSIMLYFKRMREIDVPEMMASILAETSGKEWEYYRAMTRQLWDEARHAMMGEVGLTSLGIDWRQIPLNFTWSLTLNTRLTPLERHAVLFTIEQGLMPKKTGKQHEWELAVASGDRLTELIQDYDWADEIVHARIGREWLVPQFESQAEVIKLGDEAWSRATVVEWDRWRECGLTQHRNWWPDAYRAACRHWGIEPDPNLLEYNISYKGTRSDLKEVSV